MSQLINKMHLNKQQHFYVEIVSMARDILSMAANGPVVWGVAVCVRPYVCKT
jgi:hypothetical protein